MTIRVRRELNLRAKLAAICGPPRECSIKEIEINWPDTDESKRTNGSSSVIRHPSFPLRFSSTARCGVAYSGNASRAKPLVVVPPIVRMRTGVSHALRIDF